MLLTARLSYQDYTRRKATHALYYDSVGSFAALDAIVVQAEAVIAGLSDAFCTHADIVFTIPLGNEHAAQPGSSVERRALLICKQGDRYATFTVPAPTSFPTVSSGPLAGLLADKAPSPFVSSVQALRELLAGTVLPDATAFPTGEWNYLLVEP